MPVTCDSCGAVADGDEPPLTWSLSMDQARASRHCESCTRLHLRSMEGKLAPEHW